jgi:hypothetical protein
MGVIILIIFLYLFLSLIIANSAKNKDIGFGGTLLICILFTPLVGLIMVLASPEKGDESCETAITIKTENSVIISCPYCKSMIEKGLLQCTICGEFL